MTKKKIPHQHFLLRHILRFSPLPHQIHTCGFSEHRLKPAVFKRKFVFKLKITYLLTYKNPLPIKTNSKNLFCCWRKILKTCWRFLGLFFFFCVLWYAAAVKFNLLRYFLWICAENSLTIYWISIYTNVGALFVNIINIFTNIYVEFQQVLSAQIWIGTFHVAFSIFANDVCGGKCQKTTSRMREMTKHVERNKWERERFDSFLIG